MKRSIFLNVIAVVFFVLAHFVQENNTQWMFVMAIGWLSLCSSMIVGAIEEKL